MSFFILNGHYISPAKWFLGLNSTKKNTDSDKITSQKILTQINKNTTNKTRANPDTSGLNVIQIF